MNVKETLGKTLAQKHNMFKGRYCFFIVLFFVKYYIVKEKKII